MLQDSGLFGTLGKEYYLSIQLNLKFALESAKRERVNHAQNASQAIIFVLLHQVEENAANILFSLAMQLLFKAFMK